MKTHTPRSHSVPLHDEWDVIVLGGGPAGCTAAAAAAREGAKTLLIEASGSLGGMGTSALVPAWCPFSDNEKLVYRGLAEKVFTASKAGSAHIKPGAMNWVPIDPEKLKRIYDGLVLEAGAKILFNTMLTDVEASGGRVETILVANKAGLSAYRAKVYIDCTGDADLSAWAGATFHKGTEKGGKLMGATHCFVLSNVDEYGLLNGPVLHPQNTQSPIYDILASGKYPLIPDAHFCNNIIGPGTVGFNAGHLWDVDNTKPETVSTALVQGRKMAASYRDALAEFVPKAFANSFLVMTGSMMGIRETRRIEGDYVLTLQDYLDRRTFPDEICRNSYFIDVHGAKEVAATSAGAHEKLEKTSFRYEKGESHGIPYRCLTPKGLSNVLVAGRSISCDHIVQGSVRVMPVCLAMGEAAGVAAGMAQGSKTIDVHAVDVQDLRGRLLKYGAYIL